MDTNFRKVAEEGVSGVATLRQGAPETMKAFAALSTAIAVHCDGCVAYHTRMAHHHGATRQEVFETVALAIYMGGGPAAVYGADAIRAYDQLSQHGTPA
jgi:AhpD family alkylhydroperoxidase